MFTLWTLAACSGTPELDPGPQPSTDSSAETPPGIVPVRDLVWEVDRQCWAVRETLRPAEYWEGWYANGCDGLGEYRDEAYADADGNCTKWSGGLHDDCAVEDPWVQPCEASSVPGCCTLPQDDGGNCFPNYYEP